MIRAMARAGASEGRLRAVWLASRQVRSEVRTPASVGVRGWGAGKRSRRKRVKGQIPDGLSGLTMAEPGGGKSGNERGTSDPNKVKGFMGRG